MSAFSWNLRLSKPSLPSTVHCLVDDGGIVRVCEYKFQERSGSNENRGRV